jgi:hypothetical protein
MLYVIACDEHEMALSVEHRTLQDREPRGRLTKLLLMRAVL